MQWWGTRIKDMLRPQVRIERETELLSTAGACPQGLKELPYAPHSKGNCLKVTLLTSGEYSCSQKQLVRQVGRPCSCCCQITRKNEVVTKSSMECPGWTTPALLIDFLICWILPISLFCVSMSLPTRPPQQNICFCLSQMLLFLYKVLSPTVPLRPRSCVSLVVIPAASPFNTASCCSSALS